MMSSLPSDAEAARVAALQRYEILDTPAEEAFDDLARLAAQVCETPFAFIALLDENRQWFKSSIGLNQVQTPREEAFVAHALQGDDLQVVVDALSEPRFADHPLVTGEPRLRYYAGASLVTESGEVLGALAVGDCVPRTLQPHQLQTLRVLARQVMAQLELRRCTAERKQGELAAVERDRLFNLSLDMLCVANFDGCLEQVNPAWTECLGWTAAELTSGPMIQFILPEDHEATQKIREQIYRGIPVRGFENRYRCRDGSFRWLSWNVYPLMESRKVFSVARDVTRRRQDEEQLRLLEACVAHLNDIVLITEAEPIDEPGPRILYVNDAFIRRTGFTREEAIGRSPRLLQGPKTQREVLDKVRAAMRQWKPVRAELINYTKAGDEFWLEMDIVPIADATGWFTHWIAIERDITERKRAEEKIQRLNRLNALISSVNEAIVRIRDMTLLYEQACRIAVENGGLLMAWVGLRDDASDRIRAVAIHGKNEGYLDDIQISVRPELHGFGPSGRAYRENQVCYSNDIATDLNKAPWREDALKRGYRSSAAFPLRVEGLPIGVYTVYSEQPGFFDKEELQLLGGLAENLSFAIEAHQRELHRQAAETALRESEQRFQLAVQGSAACIWDWNVLTGDFYYSHQYLKMLGYNAEECPHRIETFFQHLHPDDEAVAKQAMQAHFAAPKQPCDLELRLLTKATGYRWFRVTGKAVLNEAGRACRMVGSLFDITERKEAHIKLHDALVEAERFREALDHVPAYIYMKDTDSRYVYANQPTLELFGCTAEDLVGSDDHRFFPPETAQRLREIDSRVFKHEQTQEEIDVADTGSGRRVYWEVKSPITLGAEKEIVWGLLGISTDITERKLSEEKLSEQATLLDKAKDAILVRGLDHLVHYWNLGAERLYGWTKEEAVGRSIIDLLYKDPADFFAAYQVTITKGEWSGEILQFNKQGQPLVVEARWTLVRDDHGDPKSILTLNTDITERKNLEEQFFRAQRMESLGTLAGGIAHDLNNVLAPILLSIDLLKQKAADLECLETLTSIGHSAQRGAEMVAQVLSFARGMEGRRVEVQPRHVIRDLARIARDTFPKNIRIEEYLAPDLWSLEADPTQMHQVLLNMCVNARDAMPGGGRLSIKAENVMVNARHAAANLESQPGPHVKIEVSDTGTGIPKKIIDKIFDPFFTTKEVGKGTGLGLATSLTIIKSHGGFIHVSSELGKGTTFVIHLPAQTGTETVEAEAMSSTLPHGNGELVLVVDDEEPVREITKEVLETFGYRTLLAADGSQAVSLYARHQAEVKLVLTDMMMPVMDGAATVRVLRRLNPEIPIIAVSGVATTGSVLQLPELGVNHFLPKPYTAEVLLRLVHKALAD